MPAAAKGRPKGYRVPDEVKARIGQGVAHARQHMSPQTQEYYRGKIRTLSILNCLGEHVEGRREMSATQIQAGLGLLRKVLPDLATHELTSGNGATTLTIITGVVRAEDLANDTKVIEHESLPHSDLDPKKEQKD